MSMPRSGELLSPRRLTVRETANQYRICEIYLSRRVRLLTAENQARDPFSLVSPGEASG